MYVGIDVSKERLDLFIRPSQEHLLLENTDIGFSKLIEKFSNSKPSLIVLESTGGYELKVLEALSKAGFKVALVNPLYIKRFGQSGGTKAKTDKIDSSIIAHYAEVYNPALYVCKSNKNLDNLLKRRKQLIDIKTQELNRLEKLGEEVDSSISEHIEWLNNKIKDIDVNLDNKIELNEELKKKEDLLTSVPGIGKVLSRTLLLELPELGKFSNKKLSSLVGLAPFNKDSGKYNGQMRIYGGRKFVRNAFYMPTLVMVRFNPVIKDFYQRLISKGKKPKVAIVACMHKVLHIVNSIIKNSKKWDKDFFNPKKTIVV